MAPVTGAMLMDSKLNAPFSLLRAVKWEHLVAGVSGGVISTLVLHPLDLIKIRFQVNEGTSVAASNRPQYHGVMNALSTIGRQEGVRGLYRGVTPNVWGAGSAWGLYFLFYDGFKTRQLDRHRITGEADGKEVLSAPLHMLAAAEAGICTLIFTNPIWVAKTRLCLQYDGVGAAQVTTAPHYRGMADCLFKITKFEGVRGLYKGFVPGVIGVSHGALQFMAYEELKKGYNNHKSRPPNSKFSTVEYLSFAALSKIFAASATYPYQVVRSRLQDQHRQYTGVRDVVKQIVRNEGWYGFYKGLTPSLWRVTPACCITFIVYESMIEYFARDPYTKQKLVQS